MCVVRVALRSWRRKAKGAALWYLGPVDRHRGLFQGGDRVVISLYSLITRKNTERNPNTRFKNNRVLCSKTTGAHGGDCPASPSQQLAELGSIPKENISPAEKRKAPMSRGLGGLSIIDSMCGGQVMKARPRSVVTAQRTSREEEEEAAGEGTARLSTAPSARGCRRSRACRGTRAPRRWRASRARPPPPPSRSAATSAPPSRPR